MRLGAIRLNRTFDRIVRAHQGAVRAFLFRLCGDRADADDLAQITFIKAYDRYGSLQDKTRVKAWLLSIAYRVFLDDYRKTKRRADRDRLRSVKEAVVPSGGLATDVEKAMASLAPDVRAVMILGIVHGLSHSDITEAVKLPLGTVKSHMKRGKAALRDLLHAYGDEHGH